MKTEDLLLVAAVGAGVYLLMKKKAAQSQTTQQVNPYNAAPVNQIDPQTLLRKQMQLNLATGALNFLSNKLSGLFGGSTSDTATTPAAYYDAQPDSTGTWYV